MCKIKVCFWLVGLRQPCLKWKLNILLTFKTDQQANPFSLVVVLDNSLSSSVCNPSEDWLACVFLSFIFHSYKNHIKSCAHTTVSFSRFFEWYLCTYTIMKISCILLILNNKLLKLIKHMFNFLEKVNLSGILNIIMLITFMHLESLKPPTRLLLVNSVPLLVNYAAC